jgi:hypothetical protein
MILDMFYAYMQQKNCGYEEYITLPKGQPQGIAPTGTDKILIQNRRGNPCGYPFASKQLPYLVPPLRRSNSKPTVEAIQITKSS